MEMVISKKSEFLGKDASPHLPLSPSQRRLNVSMTLNAQIGSLIRAPYFLLLALVSVGFDLNDRFLH